jgi:RHS repeat-associated protein
LAMLQNHGESANKIYLYHNDPNGCPTRLLDVSGDVVWAAQYSGWGEVEKLLVDRVDNPIRLQGQYEDEETGMHYNRYRYYDSSIGIFVTQDPLRLMAGENIYSFALNTQWIDPIGLSCRSVGAQNLRNLGLEGVDLAGSSFNRGSKQLRAAGFECVGKTSTGRQVFRHPTTLTEVYYDSRRALSPGQQPHWHIRDAGGQAYNRSGRAVSRAEGAGHIPAS